jgi:hypothetical protein
MARQCHVEHHKIELGLTNGLNSLLYRYGLPRSQGGHGKDAPLQTFHFEGIVFDD